MVNVRPVENQVENASGSQTTKPGNFLYDSLKPLWWLTHYTGTLFDWCYPISVKAKYNDLFFRSFVIAFAFCSLLVMIAFESYITYFYFNYGDWESVGDLILYFIWLIPVVQAWWGSVFLILNRKKLLEFFSCFHQLEKQMAFFPNAIRWKRFIAYLLYFVTGILTLVGVAYMAVSNPGGTYFLTSLPAFNGVSGPPVIAPEIIEAFEIIAFFCVMLYQTVTDLAPAFIYYHCGTGLITIANELGTLLPTNPTNTKNMEENQVVTLPLNGKLSHQEAHEKCCRVHLIWSKYNELHDLVKRADFLLGSVIIVDYGIKFSMVCLLIFSGLHNYFTVPTIETATPFGIAFFYLLRFSYCIHLKSNLYKNLQLLLHRMSHIHNRHWFKFDVEERKTFSTFQDQVNRDQLTATPSNLFTITPSLLLTLLSLTITYVIILLQYQ